MSVFQHLARYLVMDGARGMLWEIESGPYRNSGFGLSREITTFSTLSSGERYR